MELEFNFVELEFNVLSIFFICLGVFLTLWSVALLDVWQDGRRQKKYGSRQSRMRMVQEKNSNRQTNL